MNELYIGEVVYNNDLPMVVIDYKNREDIGSMSYDRSYKLCLLSEIEHIEIMSQEEFDRLGTWIDVRGTKYPDIKRVEGVAPFVITPIKSYQIRQRKPKTITIYE